MKRMICKCRSADFYSHSWAANSKVYPISNSKVYPIWIANPYIYRMGILSRWAKTTKKVFIPPNNWIANIPEKLPAPREGEMSDEHQHPGQGIGKQSLWTATRNPAKPEISAVPAPSIIPAVSSQATDSFMSCSKEAWGGKQRLKSKLYCGQKCWGTINVLLPSTFPPPSTSPSSLSGSSLQTWSQHQMTWRFPQNPNSPVEKYSFLLHILPINWCFENLGNLAETKLRSN